MSRLCSYAIRTAMPQFERGPVSSLALDPRWLVRALILCVSILELYEIESTFLCPVAISVAAACGVGVGE